jgi:hypothetical protein
VDGRSGDVVVGGALDDMMVVVSVESLRGNLTWRVSLQHFNFEFRKFALALSFVVAT